MALALEGEEHDGPERAPVNDSQAEDGTRRTEVPAPPAVAPPGLSGAAAAQLLLEHGRNELAQQAAPSAWLMLGRQLASPLVVLLIGAAAVSGALGEVVDAIAIGTIVVLNSAVGFVQEYRAERALLALRAMTAPRARVRRDGVATLVSAAEVVPGDVLLLKPGDIVAADAILHDVHDLAVNEALLTGESLPVNKTTNPSPAGAPLAERFDRVFQATAVVNGTGEAVVVATAMATEVGRIAGLLGEAESGETPLQRHLSEVSRSLLVACLAVVGLVALIGVVRGDPLLEVLLSAVSLAVAAVPEGLPAIVTIALAIGVQRLAARHVLVRRLHAVETLGALTVICTDKTGTLTTGSMSVRETWGPDRGELLRCAASCVDAELGPAGGVGEPTEVAILLAAAEVGLRRDDIEAGNPRVSVQPFDARSKRMAVLRRDGVLYVKGAPERLLLLCTSGAEGAAAALQDLASRGLRVLAVATGQGDQVEDLRLVGLLGLADPPRPEAVAAISAARRAGVVTVMITGDHPVTAHAIARELGVHQSGEDVAERVHARATPEDKLHIVRAWKERGAVVAMTGDGVNDAPAIREANVGIAMGRAGTEVTREAAAVVLTDDNFASIVEGVREGRNIYLNIRKTLVYLLAGNASELLVMLVAALMGLPLPLLPLHLLWINLVTDGLPALALVMDPADRDVMVRPPRDPSAPILGRPEWSVIFLTGALEATVTLGVFMATLDQGVEMARSMAFSTLVFGELFRAFAARSDRRVFFEVGALSNLGLLGVVVLMGALQVALHQIPATAGLFRVLPLSAAQLLLAVGLGLIPVTVLECRKLIARQLNPDQRPA
jgi:P-type Ca2+ transporter type 2C